LYSWMAVSCHGNNVKNVVATSYPTTAAIGISQKKLTTVIAHCHGRTREKYEPYFPLLTSWLPWVAVISSRRSSVRVVRNGQVSS
jgi:cytochrome c553